MANPPKVIGFLGFSSICAKLGVYQLAHRSFSEGGRAVPRPPPLRGNYPRCVHRRRGRAGRQLANSDGRFSYPRLYCSSSCGWTQAALGTGATSAGRGRHGSLLLPQLVADIRASLPRSTASRDARPAPAALWCCGRRIGRWRRSPHCPTPSEREHPQRDGSRVRQHCDPSFHRGRRS